MRVLVTGCAGFIGSHLSERFVADGHEVVGVDSFTPYYERNQKDGNITPLLDCANFTLIEADLAAADLSAIVEGVDLIYHQAAQPGVRSSWGQQFETYIRDNILGTQRLLEAVKEQPLRKFVYASSSSIYGDAEAHPTCESVAPRPVSPYGVTKLAAEHLVHLYWRNYGLPVISLRYFTVYGPRQRPDMAFNRFIRWALDGEPIQVYGDGEQTRDFTFVSDAVAANVAAGLSSAEGQVFNIGGGSQTSVNQALTMISTLLERPIDTCYLKTERGDVRHTSADTRAARELLGYCPQTDLLSGLEAEVQWIMNSGGA
jgi:nucleoside-diphosphate-sugar epimerase